MTAGMRGMPHMFQRLFCLCHKLVLIQYRGWWPTVNRCRSALSWFNKDEVEVAPKSSPDYFPSGGETNHSVLFDQNPQAMWVYDLATLRFLAVNEAAVRCYGYSRDEFLALTIADIRPLDDVPRLMADVASTSAGLNFAGEWRHRTKSGEILDVEIRSHVLSWEGRAARLVVAFDISVRKRATQDLDHFFNLSQDLLCIASREGKFLRLNPEWERTFGYPLEKIVGRSFSDFSHPDDIAAALAAAESLDETGGLSNFTNRFRCQDGSYRTLEWYARSLDGVIYSVARDVTERLKAEARLRDLSRAIEQSPASVVITDIEGSIEYVNPKFEALTGYSAEEVLGKNSRILQAGRTSREEYAQLWRTILAGETWEGEFENKKKDGTLYQEHASISPIRDEQGRIRHFVAVKEDITERRRLEAQLIQSQKLEAIGLLAGGIAHDFNNLLTVINGYSEIALANPAIPQAVRKELEMILHAGQQAAGMTRQLLVFGRRQPGTPSLTDVNPIVADLADFYSRVLPANIQLEIVPSPRPALVVADPPLLQQVVMNLVLNARDAMPRGRLRVQVELVRPSPAEPLESGASSGRFVRLEVSDTGVGMTPDVLNNVFTPFFSTKPPGQGTGLGLSTVFGIVKQANGSIHVTSTPGAGATFRIYLPDVGGSLAQTPPSRPEQEPQGNGQTILLVEDMPDVRRFSTDVLRNLGYVVLVATNGEEALAIARRHHGVIDLVLTDCVMPGLSGPETADRLRREFPAMAVLFASGHVASLRETSPGAQFLTKPFTVSALAQAVHQALQR